MARNTLRGVKLLILDMDNTLCDTFHTLSKAQWGSVERLLEEHGERRYAQLLRRSFGKVGFADTAKSFPPAIRTSALRVFARADVSVLHRYPDAEAILRLPIPKVLVSRGERGIQLRKIRHLGLRQYVEKVILVPTFKRKVGAFERVLREYHLKPSEVLVVGDRVEDEITDAQRLGIKSCLVLRPDWPVHRGVKPTMTVRSLATLARRLPTPQAPHNI